MIKARFAFTTIPILAAILLFPLGIAHAGACTSGTPGNDKFSGTDFGDCFEGFAGNDKIQLGDGSDVAAPGDGKDRVAAGDGNDFIVLENDGDVDRILCGDGDDFVLYLDALDSNDILRDCENIMVGLP